MQVSDSPQYLSEAAPIHEVDARGLACPLPLLKTKQKLRDLASGELLQILATDRGSVRDIKAFADLSGHVLVEQTEHQGVYRHLLRKA